MKYIKTFESLKSDTDKYIKDYLSKVSNKINSNMMELLDSYQHKLGFVDKNGSVINSSDYDCYSVDILLTENDNLELFFNELKICVDRLISDMNVDICISLGTINKSNIIYDNNTYSKIDYIANKELYDDLLKINKYTNKLNDTYEVYISIY